MATVDLNSGVLTDISGLEADGDQLVATRPIYEGKVLEKTICSGKPVLATLRARAFPKPEADADKSGTAMNGFRLHDLVCPSSELRDTSGGRARTGTFPRCGAGKPCSLGRLDGLWWSHRFESEWALRMPSTG